MLTESLRKRIFQNRPKLGDSFLDSSHLRPVRQPRQRRELTRSYAFYSSCNGYSANATTASYSVMVSSTRHASAGQQISLNGQRMGIPPHRYMNEASASWWWRLQCERLALGGAVGVQLGQEVPLLVAAQSEKNARAHGVGEPTSGLPPRSSGVARPQSALTGVGARLMKQQLEVAAAARLMKQQQCAPLKTVTPCVMHDRSVEALVHGSRPLALAPQGPKAPAACAPYNFAERSSPNPPPVPHPSARYLGGATLPHRATYLHPDVAALLGEHAVGEGLAQREDKQHHQQQAPLALQPPVAHAYVGSYTDTVYGSGALSATSAVASEEARQPQSTIGRRPPGMIPAAGASVIGARASVNGARAGVVGRTPARPRTAAGVRGEAASRSHLYSDSFADGHLARRLEHIEVDAVPLVDAVPPSCPPTLAFLTPADILSSEVALHARAPAANCAGSGAAAATYARGGGAGAGSVALGGPSDVRATLQLTSYRSGTHSPQEPILECPDWPAWSSSDDLPGSPVETSAPSAVPVAAVAAPPPGAVLGAVLSHVANAFAPHGVGAQHGVRRGGLYRRPGSAGSFGNGSSSSSGGGGTGGDGHSPSATPSPLRRSLALTGAVAPAAWASVSAGNTPPRAGARRYGLLASANGKASNSKGGAPGSRAAASSVGRLAVQLELGNRAALAWEQSVDEALDHGGGGGGGSGGGADDDDDDDDDDDETHVADSHARRVERPVDELPLPRVARLATTWQNAKRQPAKRTPAPAESERDADAQREQPLERARTRDPCWVPQPLPFAIRLTYEFKPDNAGTSPYYR